MRTSTGLSTVADQVPSSAVVETVLPLSSVGSPSPASPSAGPPSSQVTRPERVKVSPAAGSASVRVTTTGGGVRPTRSSTGASGARTQAKSASRPAARLPSSTATRRMSLRADMGGAFYSATRASSTTSIFEGDVPSTWRRMACW